MTIAPGDTVFPNNAIAIIADRIKPAIDPDLFVAKRELNHDDGEQSVGVFGITWQPDETSMEFLSLEPTVQRYLIVIQGMVKHTKEEEGISIHSILAKRLRSMLYRDGPLQVGLNALQVVMNNSTERIQRRGGTLQRYLSNEISGSFVYMSWLEFWLETETV